MQEQVVRIAKEGIEDNEPLGPYMMRRMQEEVGGRWTCLVQPANQLVEDFDNNVSYGFHYRKGRMMCASIGNTGFVLFKTGLPTKGFMNLETFEKASHRYTGDERQ